MATTITDVDLLSREEYLEQLHINRIALPLPSRCQDNSEDYCEYVCAVCYTHVSNHCGEEGEQPVLLHGTHMVGEKCLRRWLNEDGNYTCPFCRTALCEDPLSLEQRRIQTFMTDDLDDDLDDEYDDEEDRAHIGPLMAKAQEILDTQPTFETPIYDRKILTCMAALFHEAGERRYFESYEAINDAERLTGMAERLFQKRLDWYNHNRRAIILCPMAPYEGRHKLNAEASATIDAERACDALRFFQGGNFNDAVALAADGGAVSPASYPGLVRQFYGIINLAIRLHGQTLTVLEFLNRLALPRVHPPLTYQIANVAMGEYLYDMVCIVMRACNAR